MYNNKKKTVRKEKERYMETTSRIEMKCSQCCLYDKKLSVLNSFIGWTAETRVPSGSKHGLFKQHVGFLRETWAF